MPLQCEMWGSIVVEAGPKSHLRHSYPVCSATLPQVHRSPPGLVGALPGLVRALRRSKNSLRFGREALSVGAIPGLVRVLPSLISSDVATIFFLGEGGRRQWLKLHLTLIFGFSSDYGQFIMQKCLMTTFAKKTSNNL